MTRASRADDDGGGRVRVLTWNLQGSQGLDVEAVAAVVRGAAPDVIALQEVQRRQARRLAAALSVRAPRWVLKHWPVVHRAEGLAVLSGHDVARTSRFVLRRSWIWAWQRRVALDVTVATPTGPLRVIDVHLSPHDHDDHRRRECRTIAAHARRADPLPVVVGDLNELPDGGAIAELVAAGWRDAWATAIAGDDDGATNWTAGTRRGRPPSQRLDYVLVPPGVDVASAVVIRGGGAVADTDAMGELSDHLPLVVTLVPRGAERS